MKWTRPPSRPSKTITRRPENFARHTKTKRCWPGAIAWSAAALATIRLAGIVADRSPKAWFAFGGLAAAVMLIVQRLALLPIGVAAGWRLTDLGLSAVATGAWCGAVGW